MWPKIKGSFFLNYTSASLRAVIIAKTVQVLKWIWSRKLSLEQRVQKCVFNCKTDHLRLPSCPGEAEEEGVGGTVTTERTTWAGDRLPTITMLSNLRKDRY